MSIKSLIPGPPGTLDASLKKHTTLLNKLKTNVLIGPSDSLIKEIDGLTLTKYLEEIVAAVVEGASKGKGDSEVAVDVSWNSVHFSDS
jgi:regulator of nonsense transcripts 2